MSNKIFLLGSDHGLKPMVERPYDSEDVLQTLLERYPELLGGDQEDTSSRYLLIKREMGVADDEGSLDRWSLDHLFVDQVGTLTLVEVKRSSDTRARREVVAQMLDYAANAVAYWPVERILSSFEETCRLSGQDPDVVLAEFLACGDQPTMTPDQFWTRVKTELAAERIRMVFVADEIPRELQRIIEFLNGQMREAEVLAIEVKQFVGQDLKTLVPHVIGQTAKSESQKGVRPSTRAWDEESFMRAVQDKGGQPLAGAAERLVQWFNGNAAGVKWGSGKGATFTGRFIVSGTDMELLRVFANDFMQIAIANVPEGLRMEFLERLRRVKGLELSAARDYPGCLLSTLVDGSALTEFIGCCEWLATNVPQKAN